MKLLDKGFIELIDHMGDDKAIVDAARVSRIGKGNTQDKDLLFYLMRNKHTSPFEMVEFKFHVKCPLFVARQWMRHRTWNYNEVSRRYTSENIQLYIPDHWRVQDQTNKQSSKQFDLHEQEWIAEYRLSDLEELYKELVSMYYDLIGFDIAREQARMVLPQSMYTEFYAKTDLHNLMHFLELRTSEHAQYEIRIYAEAIIELIKEFVPWTIEAWNEYRRY